MKIEEDNHVKRLAEQLYEHQTTGRFTDIRLVCSNGSVLGKCFVCPFKEKRELGGGGGFDRLNYWEPYRHDFTSHSLLN